MTFLNKSFKLIKKVLGAILNLLAVILIILFALILILEITTLIFMIIRNITGYCTPFMSQVIEKTVTANREGAVMWANS